MADHRNKRDNRNTSAFVEPVHGIAQQRLLTPKLIQYKPLDEGLFLRFETVPGAEQVRKRPTAIDVSHQIHIGLALTGNAHVDDVAGAQVDLRRTAPTLDDYLLIVAQQAVQGLSHDGPQARLPL